MHEYYGSGRIFFILGSKKAKKNLNNSKKNRATTATKNTQFISDVVALNVARK